MKHNLKTSVERVLAHEAGYVDHPNDPGGATNMGVTQATLSKWRGYPVTKSEVRQLSKSEVIRIYDSLYWDPARCDHLPSGLDYAVFDFAINSGVSRAVKELQKVLHVRADGVNGGITQRAVAQKGDDIPSLIDSYLDRRLRFMKRIPDRKHGGLLWDTFGKGWSNRVAEVRVYAQDMARWVS